MCPQYFPFFTDYSSSSIRLKEAQNEEDIFISTRETVTDPQKTCDGWQKRPSKPIRHRERHADSEQRLFYLTNSIISQLSHQSENGANDRDLMGHTSTRITNANVTPDNGSPIFISSSNARALRSLRFSERGIVHVDLQRATFDLDPISGPAIQAKFMATSNQNLARMI